MLCIDEMGPISAKTYFAPRWTLAGHRPKIAPDYGRRAKVWTFGALEPATGLTLTHCADSRNSLSFLDFLNRVADFWPEGDLVVILDNLSIHRALNVLLWLLVHGRVRFLFLPTYSPWLNLIEPWWKTLRSLALTGRRFDTADQIRQAIASAADYWNASRHPYQWRKAA